MKKAEVIGAYRCVIQLAGVQLVAKDEARRPRLLFGGYVCRVIGAAWLHLVQPLLEDGRRLSQVGAGLSAEADVACEGLPASLWDRRLRCCCCVKLGQMIIGRFINVKPAFKRVSRIDLTLHLS